MKLTLNVGVRTRVLRIRSSQGWVEGGQGRATQTERRVEAQPRLTFESVCARGAATRNLLDQSCQGVREAGIYQGCLYADTSGGIPWLILPYFPFSSFSEPVSIPRKGEEKGDVDRGSNVLPVYRTPYVPIGIILVNFETVSDPLLCNFSAGKIKKPRTVCSVKMTIRFLQFLLLWQRRRNALVIVFLNGDIYQNSRERLFKNRKDLLCCSGMSVISINGVMEIMCISRIRSKFEYLL